MSCTLCIQAYVSIYNAKEIDTNVDLFQKVKILFNIISYLFIFIFKHKNYLIYFYPKKRANMKQR